MIAPPVAGSAADITALFAEARRRRRRRRITAAAVSLAVAGSVMIGLAPGGGHHDPAPRAAASPRHVVITKPHAPGFTLPAAHVAWVDYSGQLHVGDVATGTQHVVANIPSDGGGWFLRARGHLYWPDFTTNKNIVAIRDYDLATGKIRQLARGETVFASADGRHLYIQRTNSSLVELDAAGSGPPRSLTPPAGWYFSYSPVGVADGGIVVNANDDQGKAHVPTIAVWYPRTGQVQVIGRGAGIMDEYTPRGGSYSLLAWTPGSCALRNCPLKITNTATLVTVTARSPLGHGFTDPGGAFSPDGRSLAVFVRRASINSSWPNHSELALISTRTGMLRVVRAAKLETQEDAGWVLWLPGGQRLLAGALLYSYAVDSKTLAARPFFFFPGNEHDFMTSPDINFSAVIIPGRDARQARRGSR
jgi:hypothetical protein